MDNTQTLILSSVLLILAIGAFVFFYIFTKKQTSYRQNILHEIEDKNKEYYLNLELKDGKYFPYYKKLKSGFKHNLKSSGEVDVLTGVHLKKHYSFMEERVIYIINNDLHYPLKEMQIDNVSYFEINKDIKTIEILVSSDIPSHFMLRYDVEKDKEGNYILKVTEEKADESR